MQHATNSKYHKHIAMEDHYDDLCEHWHTLKYETWADTFEAREKYRQSVDQWQDSQQETHHHRGESRHNQRHWDAGYEHQDKRRRTDCKEEEVHTPPPEEEAPTDSGIDKSAQHLISAVSAAVVQGIAQSQNALQAPNAWGAAASAANPGAAASSVQQLHPGFGSSSSLQLSVMQPPRMVPVPMEQLRLIQDSLERAEHAISGALASTVENCSKLASERTILHSTIATISRVTGQPANLFR